MEHIVALLILAVTCCVQARPGLYSGYEHEGFLIDHEDEHLAAVSPLHLGYQEHHKDQTYHGPTARPVVLPSGHLADTPEVSVAKTHHLAAVAQAKAAKYYGGDADSNYGGAYGYTSSHGGYAVPVVLPNGHIADTHEVAAAKSAHFQAVAKAKADSYYSGAGEGYGYTAGIPYSQHGPVVMPDGHLADTPEVAEAKARHMAAMALAEAQQAYSHDHDNDHDYNHDQEHDFHYLPYSHESEHVDIQQVPVYLLEQEYSPLTQVGHGGYGYLSDH